MNASDRSDTSLRAYLARRPLLCCHILMLIAAVLMLAVTTRHLGLPVPRIHDEFAYLLQAETFASGRLTNPTPPHHAFIETFHVIMEPTYTAKYFPGQALPLALGFLLGLPIAGIWLTGLALVPLGIEIFRRFGNLFCTCIVTLFVYVQFFLLMYFGHTYWGGSFFMLCGGLMLLAVLLWRERRHTAAGILFGIGAGFCLLTRPYEGFFWGAACLAYLAISSWMNRRETVRPIARGAGASALIALGFFAVFAAGLLLYNRAVTENCFSLPYTTYGEEYWPSHRDFIWQDPPIKTVDKPQRFNDFNSTYLHFNRMTTLEFIGNGLFHCSRMIRWILPYGTWVLFLPFVAVRAYRGDYRGLRLLVFIGILPLPCILTSNNYFMHYYAPWVWIGGIFCALLLSWCLGIETRKRYGWGFVKRAVPVILLLAAAAHAASGMSRNDPRVHGRWFDALPVLREKIQNDLADRYRKTGRRQLVFVDYAGGYRSDFEFVYNGPAPWASPVTWARNRGPEKNRALIDDLVDHRAWLLDVGKEIRLLPYGEENAQP